MSAVREGLAQFLKVGWTHFPVLCCRLGSTLSDRSRNCSLVTSSLKILAKAGRKDLEDLTVEDWPFEQCSVKFRAEWEHLREKSLGLLACQGDPSLKSKSLFVVECSFWLDHAKSDEVLFSDLARKVNRVGSIGLLLRTVWNQWISCEPSCWSRFAVASYHMPWARLRTNGSFTRKCSQQFNWVCIEIKVFPSFKALSRSSQASRCDFRQSLKLTLNLFSGVIATVSVQSVN